MVDLQRLCNGLDFIDLNYKKMYLYGQMGLLKT